MHLIRAQRDLPRPWWEGQGSEDCSWEGGLGGGRDPRGVSDSWDCHPSSRHTGGQGRFDDREPAQTPSAQRHVLEVLKRSDVFEIGAVCPMKLGFERHRRGGSGWRCGSGEQINMRSREIGSGR